MIFFFIIFLIITFWIFILIFIIKIIRIIRIIINIWIIWFRWFRLINIAILISLFFLVFFSKLQNYFIIIFLIVYIFDAFFQILISIPLATNFKICPFRFSHLVLLFNIWLKSMLLKRKRFLIFKIFIKLFRNITLFWSKIWSKINNIIHFIILIEIHFIFILFIIATIYHCFCFTKRINIIKIKPNSFNFFLLKYIHTIIPHTAMIITVHKKYTQKLAPFDCASNRV